MDRQPELKIVDVVTREGTFRVINPDIKTAETTTLAPITICSPSRSLRLSYIIRWAAGKFVHQVRIDNQVVVLVQRFNISYRAIIRRRSCHGDLDARQIAAWASRVLTTR